MTDYLLAFLCVMAGGLCWATLRIGFYMTLLDKKANVLLGFTRSQCNDLQACHNMTAKCRQHLADLLELAMGLTAQKGKS